MKRDLKKLLLHFYNQELKLEAMDMEVEERETRNIYHDNSTDVDYLQKVLDCRMEVREMWYCINDLDHEIRMLNNEIIDILTSIDFPMDTKIPVDHDGITQLLFWYDEDGYVNYELAL